MSDQELKFFQEEDTICKSMHHLSTAAHHHHPTTVVRHKTTSESNSTKRQSPLSPFQEPVTKKATLHPPSPPSTTTSAAPEYHLLGFTKLPLPHSFPTASPPPLRRTSSEPIYSPDAITKLSDSPGPILNQENSKNVLQESFPFPNLLRTVSDPSPVDNWQAAAAAAAATTPPRPPVGRNPSRSPSCGESPSAKRLKRMRERLKEMNQWWNQVVSEGDEEEEEDSENENYSADNNPKEESENHMENPSQEAVWVEKDGECLVLHFRCPCGNGYQILLSGNNCYYKLTNF